MKYLLNLILATFLVCVAVAADGPLAISGGNNVSGTTVDTSTFLSNNAAVPWTNTVGVTVTSTLTNDLSKLVARYKLNSDLVDATNANNGTNNGGVFISGQAGNALQLHGTNSANLPRVTAITNLGKANYTMMSWFNATAAQSGWGVTLSTNAGAANYQLIYIIAGGAASFSEGGGANHVDGVADLRGAWHHVTGVKSNATMYLYIDGVLTGTPVVSTFNTNVAGAGGSPSFGYPLYGDTVHKIALDDVMLWSTNLSAAQILSIYNAGAEGAVLGPTVNNLTLGSGVTYPDGTVQTTAAGVGSVGLSNVLANSFNAGAQPITNATIMRLGADIATDADSAFATHGIKISHTGDSHVDFISMGGSGFIQEMFREQTNGAGNVVAKCTWGLADNLLGVPNACFSSSLTPFVWVNNTSSYPHAILMELDVTNGNLFITGYAVATNGFKFYSNTAPTAASIGGTVGAKTNHLVQNVGGNLVDYYSDGTTLWSKQLVP